MVEVKRGDSPYHQIRAIYTRNAAGDLIFISGLKSEQIESQWVERWKPMLVSALPGKSISFSDQTIQAIELDNTAEIASEHLDSGDGSKPHTLEVYETKLEGETQIRGLVKIPNAYFGDPVPTSVVEWVVKLVLKTSRLAHCNPMPIEDEKALTMAHKMTKLFSHTLRNIAEGDRWDYGGSEFFERVCLLFTSRRARLDLVLPAFPCKSTSLNKVAGTRPDKGEELALRGLFLFVKDVERIYAPGARVLIASDGHVFSDNIGVDDEVVDTYSAQLIHMKDAILGSESHKIEFFGLPQLVALSTSDPPIDYVSEVDLPNYVNTSHTGDGSLCRTLMVSGFGIDGSALRHKIDSGDKAALALYRGFSRFMLEDLSHNPFMLKQSKSKQKKIAPKIAFEMLKRNQAYSNLVELLFPAHVRLSIHAHVNAGPKFGVDLLWRFNCHTTASLLNWGPESTDDLLHVPTPWHNCVVKIAGQGSWLLVKAVLVKEATDSGMYTMEWTESTVGDGGYFLLTPTKPVLPGVGEQFSDEPEELVEQMVAPVPEPATPQIVETTKIAGPGSLKLETAQIFKAPVRRGSTKTPKTPRTPGSFMLSPTSGVAQAMLFEPINHIMSIIPESEDLVAEEIGAEPLPHIDDNIDEHTDQRRNSSTSAESPALMTRLATVSVPRV